MSANVKCEHWHDFRDRVVYRKVIRDLGLQPSKELFWKFFLEWLTLISKGQAEEAFGMMDEPPPSGQAWTPQRFLNAVREANGGRNQSFTWKDIDLSSESLEDCLSDSTLSRQPDGSYLAHFYFPD